MEPLPIIQGTTNLLLDYGKLPLADRFYIKRMLEEFCRKKLTTYEYIRRVNRFVTDKSFYVHDQDACTIRIPAPFQQQLLEYLAFHDIKYILSDEPNWYTPRPLKLTMNPAFIELAWQTPAINFISDRSANRKGLELQTGKGKSFCATKAIHNLGYTGMIIMNGLVEQWKSSLESQTDIGENTYVIQGINSIKKLFNSDLKPDIFICSLGTIRPYVLHEGEYADLPPFSEFVKRYGIGVKIVDEAHLCFHASCLIDLAVNIKHNVYLTATFDTANTSVKKIFRTYYPDHMRYGGDEYDKYTHVTFYTFNGNVPDKACLLPKGYSHAKYEQFLLNHPSFMFDWLERILIPILNSHYVNKKYVGKKALIFCATAEMIHAVCEYVGAVYKHLKVVPYLYEDEESQLVDGDIIVSTHKGAGTGKDVANLMLVVNTISFQASTTAKQVLGRLRKPKDGTTPEYVDMADTRIMAHVRHWRERSAIFKDLAKVYREYRL
jgi:hypothetical protein